MRHKLYAGEFLSGFQMEYDMGLGGCWLAGYYLGSVLAGERYSELLDIPRLSRVR
jgi:hypothetical protein